MVIEGNSEEKNEPRACNKALIISVALRPCLCGEATKGGTSAGTLVPMTAISLWEPSLTPYAGPQSVLRTHEGKCDPPFKKMAFI